MSLIDIFDYEAASSDEEYESEARMDEPAVERASWGSDSTDKACTETGNATPDESSPFQVDEMPQFIQAEKADTEAFNTDVFSPIKSTEISQVEKVKTEVSMADLWSPQAEKAGAGASYADVLMENISYVIDPEGEVILLLKDGDRPFAVWEDEPVVWSEYTEDIPPRPAPPKERSKTVSYRTSEKHLKFASPVFRCMLENNGSQESAKMIVVRSFSSEALLICLNIIHGKVNTVPRRVSRELLARITAVAEHFECLNTLRFCADTWFKSIKSIPRTEYSRDLVVWLWITYVWGWTKEFDHTAWTAINHGSCPVPSLGLSFPGDLICALNDCREAAIQRTIDFVHDKLNHSLGDGYWRLCTAHNSRCRTILVGGLLRYMHEAGMYPKPEAPFRGITCEGLREKNADAYQTAERIDLGCKCYRTYIVEMEEKFKNFVDDFAISARN
ncbi:uncharacterized protein DSM5745_00391 [Aspergillus mulundensis]|uniref:Uncharacterized protein n=1 Tax=Aspergillus mulundensis TaxID=1810919 RepID=A0A3D8T3G9_9EURO|nr:hypothetical protein DSM5745_00391 [Aspergillus mulundensis]RDW93069.1 hypothetical protein DSM5745_00391 [Aspergillus mulundensis]